MSKKATLRPSPELNRELSAEGDPARDKAPMLKRPPLPFGELEGDDLVVMTKDDFERAVLGRISDRNMAIRVCQQTTVYTAEGERLGPLTLDRPETKRNAARSPRHQTRRIH